MQAVITTVTLLNIPPSIPPMPPGMSRSHSAQSCSGARSAVLFSRRFYKEFHPVAL